MSDRSTETLGTILRDIFLGIVRKTETADDNHILNLNNDNLSH